MTPKCGHCDGTSFELNELKVTGAKFRHHAVNCSRCGAITSALDYESSAHLIRKLAKKLNVSLD